MQVLPPTTTEKARVAFFVPRWIPDGMSPRGAPYKTFPVLSSLAHHGYTVDLVVEHLDGVDSPATREALRAADAVVTWCAELNPGVQIPGMIAFLSLASEVNPDAPRIAGGGFFALTDRVGLDLAPLAERSLGDSGVGSLVRVLDERLGHPADESRVEAYDDYSVRTLDLSPFVRPEAMIFGNEEPSLQIPTGYGCSKRCNFCYYERTRVQLLPARKAAETVALLRDRYGVRQFLFGELDFLAARPRALDLARRLVEAEADVRWFALVSVVDLMRLDDEDLDLLAASGCAVLEIGTETGSPRGVTHIGKRFTIRDSVRQTRRLLDRGITPLHNFMFGYEGETASDRRRSISLVRRLRGLDDRVRFNFRIYQAVPNTSMGERVLDLLPALPRNLAELLAYREESEDGRAMPWLGESEERAVHLLADFFLPLGYDDFMQVGRPTSALRRALRLLARARCRMGVFRFPFEVDLFSRRERIGLAGTWLS